MRDELSRDAIGVDGIITKAVFPAYRSVNDVRDEGVVVRPHYNVVAHSHVNGLNVYHVGLGKRGCDHLT